MKAVALFLLVVAGCGGVRLTNDLSMPAVDAKYPTAEIIACGKRWHGLAGCQLRPGEDPKGLNIQVQGYYTGTVRFFANSDGCTIDETVGYQNSQAVSLPEIGIQNNCVIGVLVSPTIEHKNAVVVHSFIGFIRIRYTERKWEFITSRVPETSSVQISFPIPEGVRSVVGRGCGISIDQDALGAEFSYSVSAIPKQVCFIEIGLIGEESEIKTIAVVSYDGKFVPLATPAIDGRNIIADGAVAVISVDNQYWLKSTVKHSIKNPTILRALTTAGRSVLMERRGDVWKKVP